MHFVGEARTTKIISESLRPQTKPDAPLLPSLSSVHKPEKRKLAEKIGHDH
jgi:hypothetical protein